MKYAIKDYDNEIYYGRGRYEWTKDLEEAYLYEDLRSLRRGFKLAHSDAMGAVAANERMEREKLAPEDPKKLVVQKIEMVPKKVE